MSVTARLLGGPVRTRWQDVAFDLEFLHHMRISYAEIENRLLIGEVLEWDDIKTAQKRTIHLNLARQRRLLKVLLDTSVRNVRGLSAGFIQSLKDAYVGGEDPAANTMAPTSLRTTSQNTWVLHKLEAYGFGGLTQSGVSTFEYELGVRALVSKVRMEAGRVR